MPLVRVRIVHGKAVLAAPSRPFAESNTMQHVVAKALEPYPDYSVLGLDVFPDVAEPRFFRVFTVRIQNIFDANEFMGEPHLHAMANRRQREIVVLDERGDKYLMIMHYNVGYEVAKQISMHKAHELRALPRQPIWLLLSPGHFNSLKPIVVQPKRKVRKVRMDEVDEESSEDE